MLSNEEKKYHQTWINFELSHFQVAIAIRCDPSAVRSERRRKQTSFMHSFVHSLTPTTVQFREAHLDRRRRGPKPGNVRLVKSGELT